MWDAMHCSLLKVHAVAAVVTQGKDMQPWFCEPCKRHASQAACLMQDFVCSAAGVDTSCKTAFVMSLLAELVAKGHRTLIFSQSRVMLDILQAAISQQSYQFRRIDGSISSATERQV